MRTSDDDASPSNSSPSPLCSSTSLYFSIICNRVSSVVTLGVYPFCNHDFLWDKINFWWSTRLDPHERDVAKPGEGGALFHTLWEMHTTHTQGERYLFQPNQPSAPTISRKNEGASTWSDVGYTSRRKRKRYAKVDVSGWCQGVENESCILWFMLSKGKSYSWAWTISLELP